jgi:hypothetical protein
VVCAARRARRDQHAARRCPTAATDALPSTGTGGFALAIALELVAWGRATPSKDRGWQPEVAVLPYATIDGVRVTVHNIRNFD